MTKQIDKSVQLALAHTFNSTVVSGLSNEQYKEYIQACSCLTLSTLIASEGHQFVKEFCEAALNSKSPTAIVQQVKTQ